MTQVGGHESVLQQQKKTARRPIIDGQFINQRSPMKCRQTSKHITDPNISSK